MGRWSEAFIFGEPGSPDIGLKVVDIVNVFGEPEVPVAYCYMNDSSDL